MYKRQVGFSFFAAGILVFQVFRIALLGPKAASPFARALIVSAASLVVLISSFLAGGYIDDRFMVISKNRGDGIIEKISVYYSEHKTCPESLEGLYSPYTVPKPKLRFSAFHYDQYRNGGCGIRFDAPLFMSCGRSLNSDWYCED